MIVVTKSPAKIKSTNPQERISENKHKLELSKVRQFLKDTVPKVKFEWAYAAFNMHDRYIR